MNHMTAEAMHTPEPWTLDDTVILCGSRVIASVRDLAVDSQLPEDRANARRIVACVNACAGVSTEWIEENLEKPIILLGYPVSKRWQDLESQRDELAANLRNLLAAVKTSREVGKLKGGELAAEVDARAALAKLS